MKKSLIVFLILSISVSLSAAVRKPLLEIFTSSDCINCQLYAAAQHAFISAKRDSLTPLKIHTDSKDPFHNASHEIRRLYYGVGPIPDAYIDGWYNFYPENQAVLQTAFDQAMSEPCYVEIDFSGNYNPSALSGTLDIHIIAEQEPGSGNYLLFCAVFSEYCDSGSGLFQDFHYPLRYIFPSPSGTAINFSGFPDTVNYQADFQLDSTWFGFDQSEIYLAVWLQSGASDKKVYQSENMFLSSVGVEEQTANNYQLFLDLVSVYPNPFLSNVNIAFNLIKPACLDISVYDLAGRNIVDIHRSEMFSQGRHFIRWDGLDHHGVQVTPGIYRIQICNQNTSQSKLIIKLK
ncbi:MAG: T9SS type A sorting domain-containing protein [bacterium]